MPRYALAVVGGTFDHLHRGHEALLRTAFALGRTVAIGVTTDAYLAAHPKPAAPRLQPYRRRRAAVARWVARRFPGRPVRIVPLADRFGGSLAPEVGVLIVSAETAEGGRAVNRERARLGRRPVPVAVVPIVLADDLRPVSSRRIRAGEIDPSGRRTAPLPVAIAAPDVRSRRWVARAVRTAFPPARVRHAADPGRGELAAPKGGLAVEVRTGADGRWSVRLRSAEVRLDPRRLPGRSERERERALGAVLRPAAARAGRI